MCIVFIYTLQINPVPAVASPAPGHARALSTGSAIIANAVATPLSKAEKLQQAMNKVG